MPVNTTQVEHVVMTDTFTQFANKTNTLISIVNGLPSTLIGAIDRTGGTIDGGAVGEVPQGTVGSLFIINDGKIGVGDFLGSGEPTSTDDEIKILKTTGEASINVIATAGWANLAIQAIASKGAAIHLLEDWQTGMVLHYDGASVGKLDIKSVSSEVEVDKFTFTRGGNFGIGTTAPTVPLQVYPTNTDATLVDGTGMFLLGDEGDYNLIFDRDEIQARNDAAASPLHFQKNGGDLYVGNPTGGLTSLASFIDSTNRIGINKDVPAETLDIVGTLQVTGDSTLSTISTAKITTETGAVMWGWTESGFSHADGSAYWRGGVDSGVYFIDYDRVDAAFGSGTYYRPLTIKPTTTTGSLRVGINMRGPGSHLLHANTDVADDGIYLQGAAGPRFTVVDNTGTDTIGVFRSRDDYVDVGSFSNDPLTFWTNSAERIRIDAAGNTSIGVTAAHTKLVVDGAVSMAEQAKNETGTVAGYGHLWIKNTNPTQLWFTDDGGNDVGPIGPLPESSSDYFESSPNLSLGSTNMATNMSVLEAHSLGARPRLVTGLLRCLSTDNGYVADDEIDVDSLLDSDGADAPNNNIVIGANTTYAFVQAFGVAGMRLVHVGGAVEGTIDLAKWDLYLRAWK